MKVVGTAILAGIALFAGTAHLAGIGQALVLEST